MKTDFLIIGSGIAGLSYALKLAEHFEKINRQKKITIITKDELKASNTSYAQGGIASVTKRLDNFQKHIEDTLNAGAYINDKEIVELVVKQAPQRIDELIKWGSRFDKNKNNEFDLAREGGHSEHRILHYKDITGAEIERALISQLKAHPFITVLEYHFAIDLITEHHFGKVVTRETPGKNCYGAYVLNVKTGEILTIASKITMLATGGIGQVYETTTNPEVATGDGIAMAYRAKAIIKDMEFVQFHPTAMYLPNETPAFLISEAVRGFGGVLRNHNGEDFMFQYDERGSLAPRDIVARAIDNEMKKSGEKHVWLDVTHTDISQFKAHFPTIYQKCVLQHIDVKKDFIPVRPAAHYLCGGVVVNEYAQTTINRLYASGETACTGLHGANRLASNSLLEALVFSHQAFIDSINKIETVFNDNLHLPSWNTEGTTMPQELILLETAKAEIQSIMSNYVGIVRTQERLQRAEARLKLIYEETEALYRRSKISKALVELRNMRSISYLIIKQAQMRNKSIGLHYMKG